MTLIYADIVAIVASICMMIADKYIITIFRFVTGIVAGINSTLVPIYVKEMSPVSVSGLTGSITQTFINLGLILSYTL